MQKEQDADRADIAGMTVDAGLPREQRIAQFVERIGDPYHYRCGSVTVDLEFQAGAPSLQQRLEGYLIAKKQDRESLTGKHAGEESGTML